MSKRLWQKKPPSSKRMTKLRRMVSATSVMGSVTIVVVSLSLFTPLFSQVAVFILQRLPLPPLPADTVNMPPSAYVVIGGGLTNDGDNQIILNPYSLNRIRTAATVYRTLPLPIVLSGAEAPWFGQWLTEQGIDNFISENASMNTCENARFTAKRIPFRRLYLITDSYHMARARRQFALNGISTIPIDAPMPMQRDWLTPKQNLNHSRRAVYEMAAYLRDVLRPQADCRRADEVTFEQLLTPRGTVVKTFN